MGTMVRWMFAGTIGMAGTVLAQTTELSVPVCKTAPRLDSDLTDATWTNAAKVTGFTVIGTERLAGAQTTQRKTYLLSSLWITPGELDGDLVSG